MGGAVCIMGVTAYLINGFDIDEKIQSVDGFFYRADLTSVPDIINYKEEKINDIVIYINSINSCISIQKYGEFNNFHEAYNDFYADSDVNSNYQNLYDNCVSTIASEFCIKFKDTDWNTLICVDKNMEEPFVVEKQNVIVVNNMDIESNIYYRAIIDSCIIYQSTSRISDFSKELVFTKELNRFKQFQIAYYSQQLFKVKAPRLFLTNNKEIEIYKKIYSEWSLDSKIEDILSMIDMSISNYSFLWEYKNLESEKTTNLMVALFTIIVSYTSIKDVVQEFTLLDLRVLKLLFTGLTLILVIRIIYLKISELKQISDYKKKLKNFNK